MSDTELAHATAVVGMSGRFPGAAGLDSYWENLRTGVCSITDFTPEELLQDGADPAEIADDHYVPRRGFLAGADRFEAELFGFGAKDAALLDPQHRLLLETAWNALEDAGYDPRNVPGTAGVFVGGGHSTHAATARTDQALAAEHGALQVHLLTAPDFLASWISYRLGLKGPSMVVQSACSTSLAAVHQAVQSLLLGECSVALAGGVTVDGVGRQGYRYQPGGVGSPDGHCRPFDEQAQGTVPGNGVGLVVLRRYEDALRDGDAVHALILGSAMTNDGAAKVGFTAPGTEGQTAALTQAMAVSGVSPRDIQYVEAHGTGTALGDPIEIGAATAAFGGPTRQPAWCGIGSVKSNIGHLDAAAGIAGLLKTTLMLEHGQFVPTAGFRRPHPALQLDRTPFYVTERTEPWPRPRNGRRRAGVSSLGMGGTNVHVVLEEAPERPERAGDHAVHVLPVSARTERSLTEAARALGRYLDRPDAAPLACVARTLQTGRSPLALRGYVVASKKADAARKLRELADGRRFPAAGEPSAPVFLLPEHADTRTAAAGDLRTFPVFREAADTCLQWLSRPRDRTPGQPADSTAAERDVARFGLLHATVRLWTDWGVAPAALVAPGLGEYVNAVQAGVFTVDEALALIVARSEITDRMSRAGGPAAGTPDPDGLLDGFEALVARIGPREPAGPFLSTVTGGPADPHHVASPRYWRDHLVLPARPATALTAAGRLFDGPCVALGADDALDAQARRSFPGRPVLSGPADRACLLRMLGELWTLGQQVDWPAVTDPHTGRAHLPGYVFDGTGRGALTPAARPAQGTRQGGESTPVTVTVTGDGDGAGPAAGGHARITELLMTGLGATSAEDLEKSFFELGGDSLSAVHLADRMHTETGIEIPLPLLFEAPSVRELISRIGELADAGTGELDALLAEFEAEEHSGPGS